MGIKFEVVNPIICGLHVELPFFKINTIGDGSEGARKNILILAIDLVTNQCSAYFAAQNKIDSVAQLVEQLTLNQWVESSNLSGVTIFKLRL